MTPSSAPSGARARGLGQLRRESGLDQLGRIESGRLVETAQKSFPPGTGERFHATISQFSRPNGLVHGVTTASNLIGSSRCACSPPRSPASTARVRCRTCSSANPTARSCSSGQFLALAVFFGIAIVLAIGVAAGVSFALAPSKGINTSAWTSSTGLDDLGQTILHVYLASLGYAILGTALAILLRSPALAVVIGVA